jgi:hypothetical protein
VPQGSVLGPVLFVTFINDLPDTVSGLAKIFANDSKIYSSVENEQQQQALQNDLHVDRLHVCDWYLYPCDQKIYESLLEYAELY